MAVIFRPTSLEAASVKADAMKLASTLKDNKGVAHRVMDGFLLRAVGNGKHVTVYVIDTPIMLALGVHGWVKLGTKAIDGTVTYAPGVKALLNPPDDLVVPDLAHGMHSKPIQVVTIGRATQPSLGETSVHYAGFSRENARSLTTTKARYVFPSNNNPFRQPFLVISRATLALGADGQIDTTTSTDQLSALGRVLIDVESLGTPMAGTNIIPGEAIEWGPAYGCAHFAQSSVDGYVVFYKITAQEAPTKLIGAIEAMIDLPAAGFSTCEGIASASALTGEFAEDADRAVYFLSTKHLAEVQEAVIHGEKVDTQTLNASPCGDWWTGENNTGTKAYPYNYTYKEAVFTNHNRVKETHLVKALPNGTVSSVKLVERMDGGVSGSYGGHSFASFPTGYELRKIGTVLAPRIEGQSRKLLIIALRTTYATVEVPEVPPSDEVIGQLWTCGQWTDVVVSPKHPGAPATYEARAVTYEQAYTSGPVAIIGEDGALQVVNIPGYVPVGADNRGPESPGIFVPVYLSMRYRAVACEYAEDYFCLLVTPMPAGGIEKQTTDWNFHLAVIHKETRAVHTITPVLGTYSPFPGQLAISCVEQGVVVDGVITQHARLLITVVEYGAMVDAGWTYIQPSAIYMLGDLTALKLVATAGYFAEAHYLGSSLLPATVGLSTGMTSRRTGVDPVV